MLPAPSSSPRAARAAFTLLEIMIALAILGLLVGLAVTKVGGIFGNSQQDVARIFVNQSLKNAFGNYMLYAGSYPSTAEGLDALMNRPASLTSSKWRGPYVEENAWPPKDPWGETYLYRFPGIHNPRGYDLWSMGPDKTDGTADDIGNWTVSEDDNKESK